jgi:hypothetical protein
MSKYKPTRLIEQIKAALGTEENDENLISVALDAHKAEIELAQIKRWINNEEWDKVINYLGIIVP